MARSKLDFTASVVETSDAEFDRKYGEYIKSNLDDKNSAAKAWASRDPNPTKQMSIRLPVRDYDLFRALAASERRTNGDMLMILTKNYLAQQEGLK
jgi:hypothetical protein